MIKNAYVIGDVHGCINTLLKLVDKLPKNANLIFVGDLCDKGNYSKDVFEFVINNNHTCIYGNHEYLFYNYIRDAVLRDKHTMWSENSAYGGMQTVKNYQDDTKLLDKHLKWIEKLPFYIQIDKYFITHGFGLPYFQRKDKKEFRRCLYLNRIDDDKYKDDWEDFEDYDVINVFGHCQVDEVSVSKNHYCIDTSCVYGHKLTAIELGSMQIFEQDVEKSDIE